MVSELICLEFFLCAKMDDSMIKLNSMNYSAWKRMTEDFLYCKDFVTPPTRHPMGCQARVSHFMIGTL